MNALNKTGVILLNGDLSIDDISHAKSLSPQIIIAADGAFEKAIQLGITPDIVLGDFDSIGKIDECKNVRFIRIDDQNSTDFEKAITFIRTIQINKIIVYGILGGEADHALGNIHTLVKHHHFDGEIVFYSHQNGNNKIGIVVNDKLTLATYKGAKVSIFPFPEATVSTLGLVYRLDNQTIAQTSGILSIRNIANEATVKIQITSGTVLTISDFTKICSSLKIE